MTYRWVRTSGNNECGNLHGSLRPVHNIRDSRVGIRVILETFTVPGSLTERGTAQWTQRGHMLSQLATAQRPTMCMYAHDLSPHNHNRGSTPMLPKHCWIGGIPIYQQVV